jgi:hypothetical protein
MTDWNFNPCFGEEEELNPIEVHSDVSPTTNQQRTEESLVEELKALKQRVEVLESLVAQLRVEMRQVRDSAMMSDRITEMIRCFFWQLPFIGCNDQNWKKLMEWYQTKFSKGASSEDLVLLFKAPTSDFRKKLHDRWANARKQLVRFTAQSLITEYNVRHSDQIPPLPKKKAKGGEEANNEEDNEMRAQFFDAWEKIANIFCISNISATLPPTGWIFPKRRSCFVSKCHPQNPIISIETTKFTSLSLLRGCSTS